MLTHELALPITVLYSELHDLSHADVSDERKVGSFSVKRIGNRKYWYHQTWIGEKRHQKFLGVETPELLENIETWKKQASQWRAQYRRRKQIVRSLKAALRMTTDPLTGKVLARLSEFGAFRAGAVLIGTNAYIAYGPMLGVRLAQSNLRTGDIDFGAIDMAATDVGVSFSEAVQSADDAFFVVPARPGSRISTALKYRGGEARVELLTPLRKGRPWQPEVIKSMKFGAQRAPYLDYLIENPVEATYLAEGGIPIVVPNPARFAWHKLIVAANRDPGSHAKSLKDIAQARELLSVLHEKQPSKLKQAAQQLVKRGGAYLKKAREGAALTNKETHALIDGYIGEK